MSARARGRAPASGARVSGSPASGARVSGSPASSAHAPGGRVRGKLSVHPLGFGFLAVEGMAEDLFVPAVARGGALDGDVVEATVRAGRRGPEACVDRVAERGRRKLAGVLRASGKALWVQPDDPRLPSVVQVHGGAGGGRDGQLVLVEVTGYEGDAVSGRVERVLGEPEDPRAEVARLIGLAGVSDEFSAAVAREAEAVPAAVRPQDREGREDLRHLPLLTIDPEDARDHDDAVAVQAREGGWRLWVAIADVSHYLRPGSATDREARARAFSVYLPHRVIPMLPPALSSGICSLVADADRLAQVVRIDFDAGGRPRGAAFSQAVIRSRAKLSYGGVAARRYLDHEDHLSRMRELAALLTARRKARGALDLEVPEAKVLLHEDDPLRVRDVVRSRATPAERAAYRVIEEFMLAANEAVAERFRRERWDCLWRVHQPPDDKRVAAFAAKAAALGHPFPAGGFAPARVQSYLESLRGRPAERSLNVLLLRALAQAAYDVVNAGHFGLAAPSYLHFTSPIRRYPDLVVHRLLGARLGQRGAVPPPAGRDLRDVAASSSEAERRAMQLERDTVDLFRAYLMRDRIGDVLSGTVTGVTGFGLFCETADPFVEGLLRVERMKDDWYELDDNELALRGANTGRAFTLGDPVSVRVEDVSLRRRQIEFAPGWVPEGSDDLAARRRPRGDRERGGNGRHRGRGPGGGRRRR